MRKGFRIASAEPEFPRLAQNAADRAVSDATAGHTTPTTRSGGDAPRSVELGHGAGTSCTAPCSFAAPRLSELTADASPQTYVHCANYSGEWNAKALKVLAAQPFVVFEKYHKIFEPPICDEAEAKIAASCAAVKKISPKVQCLMYVESDWARLEYSLGHWFKAHPEAALQCPNSSPESPFVTTNDTIYSGPGDPDPEKAYTYATLLVLLLVMLLVLLHAPPLMLFRRYNYLAYDFNNSQAREMWIQRVTKTVAGGHVDGAFIDGNRGLFHSGITGPCSKEKQAGWAAGLQQAVSELAQRLGPNKVQQQHCVTAIT